MQKKNPAWTDELRELAATAAIASLVHASQHGDTGYAARLLKILPQDEVRTLLAIWFNKHTPIHVGATKGKVFARLRKETDPNFRPFNLPKSKAALRYALVPGFRFARLLEGSDPSKGIDEIELRFKQRASQHLSTTDIKKAALSALAHAEAHGNVNQMRLLVEAQPSTVWSGGFRAWLYTYSPIRKDRKSGRWRQAKTSDPDYRPYDIEGATRATVLGNRLPSAGNLIRDDHFTNWENELPNLSHEELFESFRDYTDAIVRRKLTDDPKACRTILAISDEWLRRRNEDDYFTWPSTHALPGLAKLGSIEAPDLGVLAALGYRVGKVHGQPVEVRRYILDYVFQNNLPPIKDSTYMAEWDKPSSPRRLRKMANVIASFIRNFKRMASDRYALAIKQWSEDLNYLHQTYYAGKFGFSWIEV